MSVDPLQLFDRLESPPAWSARTNLDTDPIAALILRRVFASAGNVISLESARRTRRAIGGAVVFAALALGGGAAAPWNRSPEVWSSPASDVSACVHEPSRMFPADRCKKLQKPDMSQVKVTMSSRHDNTAASGIAPTPSAPPPGRHLSVVRAVDESTFTVEAQQIFAQLSGHILVAEGLGLEPLTVDERAAAMLEAACDGWRSERRCRDDGEMLDSPHPHCVRAQYHHDVLLLEHGLLDHERDSDER